MCFTDNVHSNMIDHIVIGEDGVYSIMAKEKLIRCDKRVMVENLFLRSDMEC